MVEPPANRGSGLRDHLGPSTSLTGAGLLVLVLVEVTVGEVLEVVEVSLSALLA